MRAPVLALVLALLGPVACSLVRPAAPDGRIVDLTRLSNFLLPGEEPPPRGPVPLNLEVFRGTTPFICPN